MKKCLILSLALLLMGTVAASAQSGFGIKAGLNYNSSSDIKYDKGSLKDITDKIINEKTGFHVGILYKINLPLGLALQPELMYTQSSAELEVPTPEMVNTPHFSYDAKSHYLQLPVNLQWGLDLMLLRPFIMVSPYLSYQLSQDIDPSAYPSNFDLGKYLTWDSNKLGYGIGLGAGIDIWKLQIAGKYNWDLGKAYDFKWEGVDTFKGGKRRCFELSLALIF